MSLDSSNYGQTLSFETYASEKLTNLKLLSILDPETARVFADVLGKHKQYLPFLPDPKPILYTDYSYAKFVDANGVTSYYGLPWIKPTSIEVKDTVVYQITLKNSTPAQLASVKQMMVKSGIEDFTVSII